MPDTERLSEALTLLIGAAGWPRAEVTREEQWGVRWSNGYDDWTLSESAARVVRRDFTEANPRHDGTHVVALIRRTVLTVVSPAEEVGDE